MTQVIDLSDARCFAAEHGTLCSLLNTLPVPTPSQTIMALIERLSRHELTVQQIYEQDD